MFNGFFTEIAFNSIVCMERMIRIFNGRLSFNSLEGFMDFLVNCCVGNLVVSILFNYL